jgi:HEAT repeat protein
VLAVVNSNKEKNIEKLKLFISDENFLIRYWGAIGCLSLGKDATPLINDLKPLLNDESKSVRIISAEVLFKLGKKENSAKVLKTALANDNKVIRLTAINSIERLGEGAKLFKNELTEKLDDPYMDVKKVAKWILRIK